MSLKKYFTLANYIANWPLYFKRKSHKGETARFVTRGHALSFDVPPAFYDVFREIFLEDFYKFKSLVPTLPAQPVVVDIGANVGYFTFQLLAARPQAKVYAYEPIQKNINLFTANLNLNTAMLRQVQLHKKAVTGNQQGALQIFYDSENDNSVIASLYADFNSQNTISETVEAVTLQSILSDNQLAYVDVQKLDCEGSEYAILYDSPAELFAGIRLIIIEVHPMDNDKRNEQYLTAFLLKLGYGVTSHPGENGCPSLIAVKGAA